MLNTSDFNYDLPVQLIAMRPAAKRQKSRLMVLKKDGAIKHNLFEKIPDYFNSGDMLILNETKVVPARLIGKTQYGKTLDILITGKSSGDRYGILSRGKYSGILHFEGGFTCRVYEGKEAEFQSPEILKELISKNGLMPLPPYINRLPEDSDRERYQCVYAKHEGSIAAPTAGLHFTDELLADIKTKGITIRAVTHHVGTGTFRPVKTEFVEAHRMDEESFEMDSLLTDDIIGVKANGGRVIYVGTTVTRAVESVLSGTYEADVSTDGKLRGRTSFFIYPGYVFKGADAIITNFHLPRSTPLFLVSAFIGKDNVLNAYNEAISAGYRFFSYGDAMLLL
ncbi:MAG: tRNA preQ1(34) S-adenosylmethionine ribosyltransferase-isomerase QueA [Nitrospirae bacterium]|nr:tRNA preQ1(34) S-adenosylmethionine ribosyltransferase-isomerase QueA [Nitrospirota bacterium]MBF0534960.1 tRNA preQ1(34) S-adenosylmethionine ribosyltransferase-isomerase QueA [Nitrospirota bacterium]MBF0617189.1 tRNA preQ1(34) S-adenosylmethionine ribosyltransferase-isomerase QueA [Nitrospirota bacterium]